MSRFVRFQDGDNVRSSPDFWESETIHALREEFSQPVQHYRTIVDDELRGDVVLALCFSAFHVSDGCSGVARGGGQGGHGPPKLLLNVFFLQLISGNLEVTRKCPKKFPELR